MFNEPNNNLGKIVKFAIITVIFMVIIQIPGTIIFYIFQESNWIGLFFSVSQLALTLLAISFINKKSSELPIKTTLRINRNLKLKELILGLIGMAAIVGIGNAILTFEYSIMPENKIEWINNLYKSSNEIYIKLFYTGWNINIIWVILAAGVLTPIYEEFIFRGYLQKNTEQIASPKTAIIVTSIVFSVMHFNWVSFIPLILISLYIGYCAYKTDNILIAIILHLANNTWSIINMNLVPKYANYNIKSEILEPMTAMYVLVAGCLTLFLIYKFYIKKIQNENGNNINK